MKRNAELLERISNVEASKWQEQNQTLQRNTILNVKIYPTVTQCYLKMPYRTQQTNRTSRFIKNDQNIRKQMLNVDFISHCTVIK